MKARPGFLPSASALGSPLSLMLLTAAAVFLAEGAIMWTLGPVLASSPAWFGAADALILTAVVFPTLYLLSYRPLVRHVAARLELQEKLALAEKLAATGRLASGVAHEINNPINAISGLVEALLQEGGTSESVRESLRAIGKNARRTGRITRGLLDFARRTPPRKESFPVKELLGRTLSLLRRDLSKAGVVVSVHGPSPWPGVFGDPDQLEQVLINLILNAKDAMGSSPVKRLTLRAEEGPESVSLSVEDTGEGIASGDLGRVFDPFFTTKPVGLGTGLGLAVSYGIVEEHGGSLRVSSTVGKGSIFTIELPREPRQPGLP